MPPERKLLNLKYTQPPVAEVVIGVEFERSPDFKIAHFGIVSEAFRSDYPEVSDQPAIVSESNDLDIMMPLLRVWLETSSGERLLQVQQDRFVFNWRKQNQEDRNYPSYKDIYPRFVSDLNKFTALLRERSVDVLAGLKKLELTYVNIIPQSTITPAVKSVLDVVKAPHRELLGSAAEGVIDIAFLISLPLPLTGTLTIDARTGRLPEKDDEKFLRLTLSAKTDSIIKQDRSFDDWFRSAHDAIVRTFTIATKDEVQVAVWGRQ